VGRAQRQRDRLGQNQPNPFSSRTLIRFALPIATSVRLEVFDPAGRRLRTLALGPFAAGYHSIEWDHRDASGNPVRPGVYLYRLIAGSFQDQKKMVLLAR
jgi:flagellar hook assembly protein FlgD